MKKALIVFPLLLVLAACAPCASALEYTLDDEASEVGLIQTALLELDFYYGDITDHYGARTQRGVRLFQEEYGLEVTGVADDETRALLYQVTGTQAPELSDMLLEMNVTLRRGDSGSAVSWLQESLTQLGYYEGEITGSYGGLTKEAVRLFQRASGLSSDGVAGRNTIKAIAQAVEEKERAEQEALLWQEQGGFDGGEEESSVDDQEWITTLSLGVKNSAVKQLQEELTELGFYTGTVTGSYGRLTKEAVRLFQRAHDIPSDGVAGPVTLAKIEDEIQELRRAQMEVAPTPTPLATAAPAVTLAPIVQATPDRYNGLVELITPRPAATPTPRPIIGVNSSVGFLSIERELKLYDNSEDVRQLQIALNSLGYYSGSASGYFDLATQAAVMGYQASKSLTVTGVANKVTLITINDDIFRRVVGAVD